VRARLSSPAFATMPWKYPPGVEVPTQHIVTRNNVGSDVELTLAHDAHILVTAAVSASSGFVGNNVFGSLIPHFLSDNCGGGGGSIASEEISRPFTGGSRNR
jgi:hypothetical protein